MRQGFPIATKGMVIGLLGGSFDPAHMGHVHLTKEALARMGLDQVWWLVSPGNPLKPRQPAPLAARMSKARRVMDHPRVKITALETQLKTRFTADTLAALRAIYPGVTFVWLMGADNLAQFHRWSRWRDIMGLAALGVLARPGSGLKARLSMAAQIYKAKRLSRGDQLRGQKPAAWVFVNMPMKAISSSQIRAKAAAAIESPALPGRRPR